MHLNRKLSLNYLQLSASGVKSFRDDGHRRRKSRKHGNDREINDIDSMSGEPLSKNNIGRIRRSLVRAKSLVPLTMLFKYTYRG